MRATIERLLRARGYDVAVHEDGPAPEVDVAIVDLDERDETEGEAAARIAEACGAVPVLSLTSAHDAAASSLSCLPKPFSPDELDRRLKALLERS